MAPAKNDIITKNIKKYLHEISAHGIHIREAYLFGSYVKGTSNEASDIDLAIISADFSGDRFDDKRKIVPLRRKIDSRIEPVPYRPEDFNENDPLVIQILRNSIKVA